VFDLSLHLILFYNENIISPLKTLELFKQAHSNKKEKSEYFLEPLSVKLRELPWKVLDFIFLKWLQW